MSGRARAKQRAVGKKRKFEDVESYADSGDDDDDIASFKRQQAKKDLVIVKANFSNHFCSSNQKYVPVEQNITFIN